MFNKLLISADSITGSEQRFMIQDISLWASISLDAAPPWLLPVRYLPHGFYDFVFHATLGRIYVSVIIFPVGCFTCLSCAGEVSVVWRCMPVKLKISLMPLINYKSV